MLHKDISDNAVKEFKNLLDSFSKFTTGGINSTEEKYLIQMLDRTIKFYFYLADELIFDRIERITINKRIHGSNKRISTIAHLKYPPKEIVTKYGRCNLPKQSVFYGTFSMMTALNEMKPEYGDLITRSFWVNKAESPLRVCPIFLNQPKGDIINPQTWEYENEYRKKVQETFPNNSADFVIELSQFISDAFARRIDSGNDRDYLFSAYFSDKILNEFEEGRIDAIFYPSVQEKLSFENIAIKPEVFDKFYELEEIRESVVVTVPNRHVRGYMMEGLFDCKKFNHETGNIIWEEAEKRYNPEDFERKKREFRLDLE